MRHKTAAARTTRRPRLQRHVLVTLAALAIGSVACGSSPDLERELSTVSSWTATARLAREERAGDAITEVYATQLRERAAQALREGRRTLAEAARSDADRARARAATDSLAEAIRALAPNASRR